MRISPTRARESRVSISPLPIPEPQLRELRLILANIISKQTRMRMTEKELRLPRDNVKAVIPSRKELERIREGGTPISAIILISTLPLPLPDPTRIAGNPIGIPRTVHNRFARLVAELVREKTGVQLSPREIALIGENGKVALPNRSELERVQSGGAQVHGAIKVGAIPINIP